MKNIHVLKTDKPSRLHLGKSSLVLCDLNHNPDVINTHHIYITSDEALPYDDSIFDNGAFYHRDAVGDVYIITKHTFKPNPRFCKKIILTTDQDLIKDGVQAIGDEFLEWFVKNPSEEEVEIDKGYRGIDSVNYKPIIPKEEPKQETQGYICPQTKKQCDDECCVSAEDCHIEGSIDIVSDTKQETLEEVAEKIYNEFPLRSESLNSLAKEKFIEGAKWQSERVYNELFEWLSNKDYLSDNLDVIQKEFEQFKKKC